MDSHIFLSYRSIEADFALKLAADLKNTGVKLWMDRLDGGIGDGEDWRRSIEQALTKETCCALVAILSPDYVTSEYCRNELARANRLKIPIYPILLRAIPDTDYPLEIERLQFIDFQHWLADRQDYQAKLGRLLKVLQEQFPAQFGAIPDRETQYLTSLIADLESRKGVLEYVELSAQADKLNELESIRPEPFLQNEWAAGFSLLVPQKDSAPIGAVGKVSIHDGPKKIALKSIAEAVAKHPRFVLVGEPGAGKTTTIHRLALEAARQRLEQPRTAPLPLVLYLPRWGTEATALEFVREHWPFSSDPSSQLASGDILLYLDGLNEMGSKGPEKAKQLQAWLAQADAPQRVVITCRAADYTGDLKLEKIDTVQAEEMDEARIRQFADSYLKEKADGFLSHVLLKKDLSEWERQREDSRSLFRLAKNPYLLAALIFVYQNAPDGDLPRNNGALIQACAHALWERERQKQTPGWIPFEIMEQRFGKLAFALIDENMPLDVQLDYALQLLGNITLIRSGCSANLLDMREKEIRFYHQLILEYFAAAELKHLDIMSKIPSLRVPSFFQYSNSGSACLTTKWDQVIINLVGISDDAEPLIAEILPKNAVLAMNCINSISTVSDDLYNKAVDSLREFVSECDKAWLIEEDSIEGKAGGSAGDRISFHAGNAWNRLNKDLTRMIGQRSSNGIERGSVSTKQAHNNPSDIIRPKRWWEFWRKS